MKLSKAILGEKLFGLVMKATFYGHFVAGEDRFKIVPTLERLVFQFEIILDYDQRKWVLTIDFLYHRLRSFGVKPILDYSVEEDLSQEEAEQREVE